MIKIQNGSPPGQLEHEHALWGTYACTFRSFFLDLYFFIMLNSFSDFIKIYKRSKT
jgi:hypothetical protein